jgi:hypothetical protein
MDTKGRIYGADVKVDINVCFYCEATIDEFSRTADHLIPESRGGIRAKRNKVPCCGDCNRLKGDMNPEEFQRALKAMMSFEARGFKKRLSYLKKISKNVANIIHSKTERSKRRDEQQ